MEKKVVSVGFRQEIYLVCWRKMPRNNAENFAQLQVLLFLLQFLYNSLYNL